MSVWDELENVSHNSAHEIEARAIARGRALDAENARLRYALRPFVEGPQDPDELPLKIKVARMTLDKGDA